MIGTLGWGIVGIGNIVKGTIAPALVADPNSRLTAGVSRDQGRAEAFAEEFGALHSYTEYSEMLADPDVDAVYIATPNALHSQQVVAAARAGKHVLCDKPLAISVSDALESVQACREAGVKLGVNFHNRHLPWVRDVAGIVASGEIGPVRAIEVQVGSGPRTWTGWRADPELAGLGAVNNVGVHALDFLRVLINAEATEVLAKFDTTDAGQLEKMAMIVLKFSNDAVAYVNCNESLANPRNDITIYGDLGRILGSNFTRSRSDGHLNVLTADGERTTHYPAPDAHALSLAAFTRAVIDHRDPDASGEDGLRSAQICAAVAASASEGRLISVEYSSHGDG